MKNFKRIFALLLCLCIVMLSACQDSNKPDSQPKVTLYGYQFPAVLDDITIEKCSLYSGEYIEDASFENCENVAALTVKNNSEKDIQLLRIKLQTQSKDMLFEVTTLTAGSTATVLEKTKQTLTEEDKIYSLTIENRADFSENVSLKDKDIFIQGNLKTINIKNISNKDIENDIYIYYKKKDENGNFLGGLTFRTKAEGGIKAGEIKQLPADSFDPADSVVVFVDYVQQ